MPDMIRTLAIVAFLPSLALAQSDVPSMRRDPIEVFALGRSANVMLDSLALWEDVSAPRARVFDAAVRVIKHHARLPVEHADTISKVVYNKQSIVMRKLAGQPMSRWLRCGTGLTGEHANSWRITLAYAVFVEPVSTDSSRVGVAVFATARNPEGVSTSSVACASTGALEREVISKVREVVQMP
jgi:hypothetical protein